MTREEAITLLEQGRGRWNGWARSLLNRQEHLVEKGQWDALSFVDFSGHVFDEPVDFSQFIFPGKVDFSRTIFPSPTSFNKAVFHGETDFFAATFQGHASFVLAHFKKTPSFIGTIFEKPPHLLNMRVVRPKLFNRTYRDSLNDPEKFSVLTRLAEQAGEHRLAHHFHGSQLVSRRHISEQWWQVGFWSGIFYQLFSNFGQSLMRPFISWVLSVLIFSWLYAGYYKPVAQVEKPLPTGHLESFWNSTRSWFVADPETSIFKASCAADEGGIYLKALYLSLKHGLLNLGGGTAEKMTQVYACLYGVNPAYSKGSLVPYIPDGVAFWGMLQLGLSAMLIFFFSLALYKRFARRT